MRLIINGDDFGLNKNCSSAIALAMQKGLISDTTMMANGACFDAAVALAKEQGFFDRIGIHFNLTEGEPLTRAIGRDPLFVQNGSFHKGYTKEPCRLDETQKDMLFRELCAQAERLLSAGIAITHADSHHYIHNYTYLAPIVAEVCRKYGIGRIRLNRTLDTPLRPHVTEGRVDNGYWREQGFVTTEHFGRLSDFRELAVPDNTEIMVHPDSDRDGRLIDRTAVADGFPCGEELDIIASLGEDISLISYRDL